MTVGASDDAIRPGIRRVGPTQLRHLRSALAEASKARSTHGSIDPVQAARPTRITISQSGTWARTGIRILAPRGGEGQCRRRVLELISGAEHVPGS